MAFGHGLMAHEPFTVKLSDGNEIVFTPIHRNPAPGERARILRRSTGGLEAQFLVGLKSSILKQEFTPEDIRDTLLELRDAQIMDIVTAAGFSESELRNFGYGASVQPMLGFWASAKKFRASDEKPEEKSVSVIVIASQLENEQEFKNNMEQIAMDLATKFGQYMVILRLIRDGFVFGTIDAGY